MLKVSPPFFLNSIAKREIHYEHRLGNVRERRFDEAISIEGTVLRELVDLARLSASGANGQPLKYILSNAPEQNMKIFPSLAWAGALKDWAGPEDAMTLCQKCIDELDDLVKDGIKQGFLTG